MARTGFVIVLLCSINVIDCVLVNGNCSLSVFENDVERTDLHCIEYIMTPLDCQTGNSNLPILDDSENSIEMTRNFRSVAEILTYNISNSKWEMPRLKFSWYPPGSGSALQDLKGFMLNSLCLAGQDCPKPEFCIIFDLTNNQLGLKDRQLQFKFETNPLNYSATYYQFEMYSLPRSSFGQKLYVNVQGAKGGETVYPAQWFTSISYQITESDVEVWFPFSEKFQFVKYDIRLEPKPGLGLKLIEKTIETSFFDGSIGEWKFTNVSAGYYKIQVQPVDDLRTDSSRCRCYDGLDFFGDRKCKPCITTTIKDYINVTGTIVTQAPAVTTSKADVTTEKRETTAVSGWITDTTTQYFQDGKTDNSISMGPNNGRTNVDIIIAVAVIASVLAIGVLVSLFVLFKRRNTCGLWNIAHKFGKNGHSNNVYTIPDPTPLKQKKILLLNAVDHLHHIDVVKHLVLLLEDKCGCNVLYPPNCLKDIAEQGWEKWVNNSFDFVDYILFVHSEASFKIDKAASLNERYKYLHLYHTDDLFEDFLTKAKEYANEKNMSKYISVSFDYTSTDYILPTFPSQHHYKLLNQLSQLVRYIHQISDDASPHASLKDVIDDGDNLIHSTEALQSAINKATRFEKSDVLWFNDRFGMPYKRSGPERLDSGIGEEMNDIISKGSIRSNRQRLSCTDERDSDGFYPPEDVSMHTTSIVYPYTQDFIPPDTVSVSIDERTDNFIHPDSISSYDCQSQAPSAYIRQINEQNAKIFQNGSSPNCDISHC